MTIDYCNDVNQFEVNLLKCLFFYSLFRCRFFSRLFATIDANGRFVISIMLCTLNMNRDIVIYCDGKPHVSWMFSTILVYQCHNKIEKKLCLLMTHDAMLLHKWKTKKSSNWTCAGGHNEYSPIDVQLNELGTF